ncbi:MAG: hypothetical protein HQL42_09275 [Alphaproteobacteria bacterium]|nr:hypothetical protein [Alphaproteobacteria bacterium]
MIFANTNLATAIRMLRESGDPVQQAHGDNFAFEERVGQARQAGYEEGFAPVSADIEDLIDSHMSYLEGRVYVGKDRDVAPDTFQDINADAALPSAVGSPLGEEQWLVRVESLDFAMKHGLISSLDEIDAALRVVAADKPDGELTPAGAAGVLDKVVAALNINPHSYRPRFAAFLDEVQAEAKAADWANALRDRLGLVHHQPTAEHGPLPVALMRYKVEEVVTQARRQGAAHPFAVPTVLDAEMWEVFHPAPRQADYGRTLHLAGDVECEHKTSEVLALRIDYKRTHLWKVGAVTSRRKPDGTELTELRQQHLLCLQYLNDRNDFGTV